MTIVIVIAAIVVIMFLPVVAPLLLLMAKGALLGAVIGGVAGGAISALTGGSFWEGFENGAFSGAIAGIISGGMAFAFTGGVASVSLKLGQTVLAGAVSGAGTSLIGDLGDKFIKGTDISWGQMLLNTAFSAVLGAVFAGVFYGLSKGFAALKLKFASGKANLPEAVGTVDDAIEGAGGAGKLIGNLDGLTKAERAMVEDLLKQGKTVEIIPCSNISGVKTPDFKVNGVLTELKTLTGTSLNTPVSKIQNGFKQGAKTVTIDGRGSGMTAEQAKTVLARIKGVYKGDIPGEIEIWTVDGIIKGGK